MLATVLATGGEACQDRSAIIGFLILILIQARDEQDGGIEELCRTGHRRQRRESISG